MIAKGKTYINIMSILTKSITEDEINVLNYF
jgi:hypothetical protein